MKYTLHIQGMTCPACKALIEDICSDFEQITNATVDLKKKVLVINSNKNINPSLKKEIESVGPYKVTKIE